MTESHSGRNSQKRLGSRHQAQNSTGLLLWQLTNRWQAAQRAALAPYGLTHVQFVLLASLTWLTSDGPVTQRELAQLAATDPMMTSQVIRALEQKLLVTRTPSASDKRAILVSPTAEGQKLARKTVVIIEEIDHIFFAPLAGQKDQFTALLARLHAANGHSDRR
ncbi:MAG: MarR family winged helix-turn-helix transcriptional regulator [Mycobacteriaceae bacterium]